MRIAYVCYWDVSRPDGVAQKINAQLTHWRRFGHQAELFALAPTARTATHSGADRFVPFSHVARRLRSNVRLAEAVTAYQPDIVYLRYDLFAPAIGKLLRRFPAVVEINSDDRAEIRGRRLAALYNEYNRRMIFSAADGFVCVTHELGGAWAMLGRPVTVIANGVDLTHIVPSAQKAPASSRPQLVWLGSPNIPWSGLDKVMWLARHLSECDFSLVGVSRGELPAPVPENVRAYGYLKRTDYDRLLRRADTAIGTLALHRTGLNEASPLKVREYLAYGLPVIAPYEDTDFIGEEPWYLLRLPNTESNVRDHLDEIRTFVRVMLGKRVSRDEVADRIGVENKERKRLSFLDRVRDVPQPQA